MEPEDNDCRGTPRSVQPEATQTVRERQHTQPAFENSANTLHTLHLLSKNPSVMLEYDGVSQTVRSVSLPPTYRNLMSKIQFAPQLTLASGQSLVIQQLESSTTV